MAHSLGSARSKILPPGEMLVLGRIYDIGDWLSANYEPKGRSNVSFTITTTTGEYVLRQSSYRKSLAGIRFEVGLVDFLRGKGYPAPEVIPARNGDKFVEHRGGFYLLTRFIPGEPYDPENPHHLLEAGRKFGLYHNTVKHFGGPFFHRLPALTSILGSERNKSFPGIEDLARQLLDPGGQKRLVELLSYVDVQSEHLQTQLKDIYPGLPKLAIQGSYGRTALIFDRDTLAGVVDYDRATYESRSLDLACAIKDFCSMHGKFRKERRVALDFDCCGRFLRAYREVSPLPEEELRFFPLICRGRHLSTIIYRCNSFLLKDAMVPRDEKQMLKLGVKLEREIAWIEWLEKHEKELVSTFRDASGGS